LQTKKLGGDAPPTTLSFRARSVGGVALSALDKQSEALLLWTALDNQKPQVFATVVGADGKKLRQRMLTRSDGEKSDVCAARSGDGWVLAWAGEQQGAAALYASWVNRYLQQVGPEKRIAGAGAITSVQLLPVGADVLATWSAAADKTGKSDVYVAKLSGSDGAVAVGPTVVAKSAEDSLAPQLAARGDGALLVWFEGADKLRKVELGADGRVKGAPATVASPAGQGAGLALDCVGDACRGLVVMGAGERATVGAFEWADKTPGPKRVLSLSGTSNSAVRPVLAGDVGLIADKKNGRGRVRQIALTWR
jgi:hypothetical protein